MSADKQTRHIPPRKKPSDFQRLRRRFMSGLLRSLFLMRKPARAGQAGFVLPTTVLLLLMLSLTVGTLSFRTFSRSGSVIAQREQQVIDSAAAPAIDRAKAKLEYLFSKDERFPGGIPSSDVIASMMLNDNNNGIPTNTVNDPYTFPGETRVDINGGGNDNAWSFKTDIDGDGTIQPDEIIVYSILMDDAAGTVALTDSLSAAKANALVTRNGPINTSEVQPGCGSSRAPEAGWQVVNAATLQKNFQITAFVANRNSANRTVSAIELQQVRQANRGNKWGAWFKYDLELFPGATRDFFWNGAMHTEGNFLIRDKFKARMISSHNSCLYTQDASEITLASKSGFQGQVLSGKTLSNDFAGTASNSDPTFHLFTHNGQKPDVSGNGNMGTAKDSVTAADQDLRKILLDPIKLFTEDVLAHRSNADWTRDTTWESGFFANAKRIYNENSATPYLDDTYRADNRYGPKAVYDQNNRIPSGVSVGSAITSNTALTALDATNKIYGLDGYWERRAIGQGLRVIVGQRLELGNPFGWKGAAESTANNRDPLHPPNANVLTEARQRRSLHDNLAAVQGMVVYHYENSDQQYPLACLANTVHPGTRETLIESRNFKAQTFKNSANANITVISNFLTGKGTNGWEYEFPATFLPSPGGTPESFGAALAANRPLGTALRNLARFAGDPQGGAPSFIPVQESGGEVIHPFPQMAMWGDYSILRRIFDERLDNSATGTISSRYDALSPADKSALHSAACTMGLLSKNLTNLKDINLTNSVDSSSFSGISNQGQVKNQVGGPVWDAFVGSPALISQYCRPVPITSTSNYVCDKGNPSREDMIEAAGSTLSAGALEFVNLLSDINQIERDRRYGFQQSPSSGVFSSWQVSKSGNTYTMSFPDDCSPRNPNSSVQALFSTPSDNPNSDNNRDLAGVALVCASQPKYPALHYLFPLQRHDQDDNQPATEEYLSDQTIPGTPKTNYIFNENDPTISADNTGVNRNVIYQIVGDTNQNGAIDSGEFPDSSALAAIAFNYRVPGTPASGQQTWKLPKTITATVFDGTASNPAGTNLNPESMQVVGIDGKLVTVSLLDKGMFDGREMMGVRMLDLDIEQLSSNSNGSDRWISNTDGIVYAFREDALREDSIVRPKASSTTWANCDTWDEIYTNSGGSGFPVTGNNRDCRLKKLTSAPFLQDPPLMTNTNISTKPIDFYADPDRRPHGFRLVNGATLNRATTVLSGMTFVSDNMVYVKGDFNLHTSTGALGSTAATACTGLIEEFTDKLIANDCSVRTPFDFYDDRAVDERNEANFANPAVDKWRPVEIVGDAVGILSGTFRDGNIADGFTRARTASSSGGNAISSYQNQNRLFADAAVASSNWKHVNPANPSGLTTPILINRNGGVVRSNNSVVADSDYLQFTASNADFNDKRGGDLEQATRTIVNAVFISGIIPSQAGQTYGGMHNFPRFLEHWINTDLHISGGFFQLNFSTSATAPFDQDAWEPGADAQVGTGNAERTRFYGAPNRIWGYDVGLQYAPSGPIARRFVTVGRPRSEFYRELPVDDPYVKNLRCATSGGSRVYPNEAC